MSLPLLPPEIWVHIASFLEPAHLETLYSVNRTLYQIAFDLRYRHLVVRTDGVSEVERSIGIGMSRLDDSQRYYAFKSILKTLQRMQTKSIASRVKRISGSDDIYFGFKPFRRVEYSFPYIHEIKEPIHQTNGLRYRLFGRALEYTTLTGRMKKCFKHCVNVERLDLDFVSPRLKKADRVFTNPWVHPDSSIYYGSHVFCKPFQQTLRELYITLHHAHSSYLYLDQDALRFPRLELLSLRFEGHSLVYPAESGWDAFREKYPDWIGRFSPNLQTLKIEILNLKDRPLDMFFLIGSEKNTLELPSLHTLEVIDRGDFPKACPDGRTPNVRGYTSLSAFIQHHHANLKNLFLSGVIDSSVLNPEEEPIILPETSFASFGFGWDLWFHNKPMLTRYLQAHPPECLTLSTANWKDALDIIEVVVPIVKLVLKIVDFDVEEFVADLPSHTHKFQILDLHVEWIYGGGLLMEDDLASIDLPERGIPSNGLKDNLGSLLVTRAYKRLAASGSSASSNQHQGTTGSTNNSTWRTRYIDIHRVPAGTCARRRAQYLMGHSCFTAQGTTDWCFCPRETTFRFWGILKIFQVNFPTQFHKLGNVNRSELDSAIEHEKDVIEDGVLCSRCKFISQWDLSI
ncbi:hypothetical protein DL96DRAFT_1579335 [Flagelloscypha sp. PMI_526]|nr:hypothetical protein DL96DRAFT_1579335 [Flagelloscypha sp. PMI_526]